jgi:hypothetical protein
MASLERLIAEAKSAIAVEHCDVWNRPIEICPCVDCTLLRIRLATVEDGFEKLPPVRAWRFVVRIVRKLRGRD